MRCQPREDDRLLRPAAPALRLCSQPACAVCLYSPLTYRTCSKPAWQPSVFDSAELTLPRDALHSLPGGLHGEEPSQGTKGDVEHRLVHNAYGALQAQATHVGMSTRSGASTDRPFLLSRAFFVGSQRHGAVWTGDNTASWEHLRLSFAMVLTLSLSGIPFAGADVSVPSEPTP